MKQYYLFRNAVLAASGWLIVGAAKAPQFDRRRDDAAKVVSPAVIVPSKLPCGSDHYHSDDDLCAQWKAADAASRAAWWAMVGTVLAFAGTSGLFWTLYYTRKAVLAAEKASRDTNRAILASEQNAKAAADAARAMERQNALSAASQRPWLSLQINSIGPAWRISKGSFILSYSTTVKNTGTMPAIDVRVHVGRTDNTVLELSPQAFIDQASIFPPIPVTAMGPGDTVLFEHSPFVFGLNLDANGKAEDGTFPSYWIGVLYRDHSGGDPYATVHRFGLFGDMPKDGEGEAKFSPGYQGLQTAMS